MKLKLLLAAVSTFGLVSAVTQAGETMPLNHSNRAMLAASADISTPSVDKHRIERPDVAERGTNKPEMDKPDIDKVEIEKPEMEKPEIEKPEIEKPEMVKPEVEKPHVENH